MIYAIAIVGLLVLIYGPQLWVQRVLKHHNRFPEANFPGTGGELARHLLDRYDLQEVRVEITDFGDHYDPLEKAVRLTRDKYEGTTMTAITVAAHECGHAFQHAAAEPLFMMRTRLAGASVIAQRVGSFLLFAPAKMQSIEGKMNNWFETQAIFEKLDRSGPELDVLFFRYPFFFGMAGAVVSFLIITLATVNLLS